MKIYPDDNRAYFHEAIATKKEDSNSLQSQMAEKTSASIGREESSFSGKYIKKIAGCQEPDKYK